MRVHEDPVSSHRSLSRKEPQEGRNPWSRGEPRKSDRMQSNAIDRNRTQSNALERNRTQSNALECDVCHEMYCIDGELRESEANARAVETRARLVEEERDTLRVEVKDCNVL